MVLSFCTPPPTLAALGVPGMTSDMSSSQGGSRERQRPPRQGPLRNSSVAELDLSFPPSWVLT